MASVTKTITETVGEIQKTTSLYFSSFEDFMEYERVVNDAYAIPMDFTLKYEPEGGRAQSAKVKLGKEYKIVGNFNAHEFPIGIIVRVVGRRSTTEEYRAEYLDGDGWWWVYAQDLEEI